MATPNRQIVQEAQPISRVFVVNLTLLLFIGVCGSGWILVYTDWFPVVGGLLTLGGLFSWLAFVSKLLSEEVIKEFQSRFTATLSKSRVLGLLITLLAAMGGVAFFWGAIRVEVQSVAQIRGFDLYREGSTEAEPRVTTSEGSSNVPVFTPFGPSYWRIKVPGYPYEPVAVFPFQRPVRYLPEQLTRPVVLIVPDADLLKVRSPYKLRISIDVGNNRRLEIDDYRWFAFWVGCASDVQIPDVERARLARLRFAVKPGAYPYLDASLSAPFADPAWVRDTSKGAGTQGPFKSFDLEFPLPHSFTVVAEDITDKDNPETVIRKSITLQQSNPSFVQVEYLHADDWKKPQ
jgi:hypothetical protein